MLRTIINFGKNLLAAIILAALIVTCIPNEKAYADYSENTIRKVDVVIRSGEWGNSQTVKRGKRYVIGPNINISKHGISINQIPKDIPIRKEGNEWFISEFDINMKLARAIATKLDSKYGVNVNLQYSTDKTTDLNAAGRIAAKCNPKIYLSVHHNAYDDNSTGYFFMTNEGDSKSAQVAKNLSNSIANNGYVPQRSNRINNGYIGEMNHVKANGRISILGEFGYFNKAEIVKICSDEYNDYVSDKIAEALYNQLQEMNSKDVMAVNNKVIAKKNDEFIKVKVNNEEVVVNNTRVVKEPEVVRLSFK
jgi:N-acetylmuramoyl-L-alanine amidase